MNEQKLRVFMISIHGLIRGKSLELGRDADTGGQTTYVVELAKALGRHPHVAQVDLLTRLIIDDEIDDDYSKRSEQIGPNARILRLPFGPSGYLRKELLWAYLDQLIDRCLHYLRYQPHLPDVIHTHYADAGYVGMQLSNLLGIPQVHTGHSLGRPKSQRLILSGQRAALIESRFRIKHRIAIEEDLLAHASLIVTSTRQEIGEQYGMYTNHDQRKCVLIPPGTDTARFTPPDESKPSGFDVRTIDRFLEHPEKPIILAISRPDTRKNIHALIKAYGESQALQDEANLVVVAGTRHDIRALDEAEMKVLEDILLDIDKYDLWGKVAIPKQCGIQDIPELYRLAVQRQGVFVNPALTEPFGLTLIEAAATGLPIVATEDGGPRDIIANCQSGLLIDPLDTDAIAAALLESLIDKERWRKWSRNGLKNVRRHYIWNVHVEKYLKEINKVLRKDKKQWRRQLMNTQHLQHPSHSMQPTAKQMLITDIDNTLLGDTESLETLVAWLRANREEVGFGVATGRNFESAVKILRKWNVPIPDVLITSVGSEIHYWPSMNPDTGWANHIRHQWRPEILKRILGKVPGLRPQEPENQSEFKLSYLVDTRKCPPMEEIRQTLQQQGLQAKLIYSHDEYLDVLPKRASKGQAIRYLAYKWGVPLKTFIVAGDSGNDEEMLVGDTLGVVVGNYSLELEVLKDMEQIYFARNAYAQGILEGLQHYGFDMNCALAQEELT